MKHSKAYLLKCLTAVAAMALAGVSAPFVSSAIAHEGHDHHAMDAGTKQEVKRATVEYTIPPIQLMRDDGNAVDFAQELDDGRPVMVNYIYTTCTDTCALTSKTFSMFQNKLGKDSSKIHMLSISIDPEQDTPTTLRKYAKKYQAGKQWNFYTGTVEDSVAAQKALDAYRGDKMNHLPTTYLRLAPGKPWLRIDGFVSPEALLKDYKELFAAK